MLLIRAMRHAVWVSILIFFSASPAQGHEYLPDGLAEAQIQFRSDRNEGASDGQLRIGFQMQPWKFLFFGVEASNPPMRAHDSDRCGTKIYERNRFWGTSWLGIRHRFLRAGLRFTRNAETIAPPLCGHTDDSVDFYKAGSVTPESVDNALTDHPGAMLEFRFSPALWAGVLYDHDFQVAMWAAYRFPRLVVSLEGARASIPHPPFPSYSRTDARLGLRFSPTGARLSRARFHVRLDLGLVHTDFLAENGWTPDPPNALLVRVMLAFLAP